jgi:hypothetical protein
LLLTVTIQKTRMRYKYVYVTLLSRLVEAYSDMNKYNMIFKYNLACNTQMCRLHVHLCIRLLLSSVALYIR